MPKHGNIFTNWFKSSKQKQKKSPQQHPIKNQSNVESAFEQTSTAIKRSPLVPRQPTNGSRNDLSSRSCRTSMFGLTFGLVSSTGSSKLSLLFGNSKQALQHKSPSCTETQSNLNDQQQQQQNGSILRKIPAHFEGHQKNVSSTTHSQLIESPTTPPGKQSATSVTQLHLSRTSPHSSIRGLVNSSPQNVASAEATISTSTPDQTNFTNTALSVSNPSLKQTAEILSSLDHSSAFTPISSLCATVEKTQKPVLQVQTITQQQKQIQFRQQHSDQLCDVQKPTYSQSINEHDQENSPNIMTSSGVTTTLNESFTELNQDSSDAEIVQVFTGGKQLAKSRASTLDLSDEQLIFSGTQSKKKARGNRRSYSTTLFSSVSNEKQLKELERKNSRSSKSPAKESTESAIDKKVFDELGNKKASFVDENENLESTMFSKCKIGHRDDFPETMSQDEKIDRLEDGKVLKTKSVELNELTDSIELKEQQQGDEEADSFGELPANGEDFSLYENVTGLGDDLKFLASMPELCDITFLVGENREPVCAVSAVLGSRSRVFHKLLYGQKTHSNQQYSSNLDGDLPPIHEQSTRRSIFGRRKESTVDESCTMNDSKRPREESITGALLRYSKSKKFKETKDAKSKYSLKRGSEPILEGLPLNQQIIEEFEPDVFRQLIEYIHTGCVTLQARTLLGLMNAADYYGLEELRKSCMGFVGACITVDTVCTLLASAERYIQYKCTKSLVQRVLEFVDNHGNEVLSLGSFALLPEHVVRLIFSREELKADELIKFQAALHWSQRYCEGSPGTADLREIMKGFFEYIEFYKIPTIVLMREVHPLNIVPDHIIMNALAYQADPKSIDICKVESPNRFRRMTLPHALNIAGSEMLSNLHRQSLVPLKCERSASTSTSGYNTECSMFSANNTSNGNLGLGTSIKSKKDERDENGRNNENEKFDAGKSISKHKKDKEKDFQNKVGKRRGSRPFRRAITLFEGKGRHT